MARVPLIDAEIPANIFRALAHAPATSKGFASMGTRLLTQTELDPKLRELVIDAVSVKIDAPYEWSHHAKPAIDAGATTDDLEALKAGDHDRLGPRERACVTYALKVEDRTVTEADVQSLRDAGLDDQQIVELTMLAGYYGMTARFLLAMDVELDEGRPAGFTLP